MAPGRGRGRRRGAAGRRAVSLRETPATGAEATSAAEAAPDPRSRPRGPRPTCEGARGQGRAGQRQQQRGQREVTAGSHVAGATSRREGGSGVRGASGAVRPDGSALYAPRRLPRAASLLAHVVGGEGLIQRGSRSPLTRPSPGRGSLRACLSHSAGGRRSTAAPPPSGGPWPGEAVGASGGAAGTGSLLGCTANGGEISVAGLRGAGRGPRLHRPVSPAPQHVAE